MCEIAFIMGKSASGKDHIYKAIINDSQLELKTVILYTTRPMRDGECDGVEYFFTDDENAERMKADGRIIEMREYNTVHGIWKYFTADDGQIDINSGNKYIVIGTLEAYEKFCHHFGKEHIMPIYIEVDDGIRLERALMREKKQEQPKYEEMCRRFLADAYDFREEELKRLGVEKRYFNSTTLAECVAEIKRDIKQCMYGSGVNVEKMDLIQ